MNCTIQVLTKKKLLWSYVFMNELVIYSCVIYILVYITLWYLRGLFDLIMSLGQLLLIIHNNSLQSFQRTPNSLDRPTPHIITTILTTDFPICIFWTDIVDASGECSTKKNIRFRFHLSISSEWNLIFHCQHFWIYPDYYHIHIRHT